jgi:hypothetical protein
MITCLSAGISFVLNLGGLLVNHVVVTTRHTMRIEQLERENAEIRAFIRNMPEAYVPRQELRALIESIASGLKRVEDLLNSFIVKQ